MADYRPKVPDADKRQLRNEAGGKCANPGCSTRRTEIHHIREWAVYHTHDAAHMIAVCPTCHDAIHHGRIAISDAVVYDWKRLARGVDTVRDHVYVEPSGEQQKLLLGTIAIAGQRGAIVFEFSDSNRLAFDVRAGEIMLLNLSVCTLAGEEVVSVLDGYLRHKTRDDVEYRSMPGHIDVTTPLSPEYLPDWALKQMRDCYEPDFASNGRLTLLRLDVLEPNLVRAQGVWATNDHAYIVTDRMLAFLSVDEWRPIAVKGAGRGSILRWRGPLNSSMFAFDK
jgi:hypothetical protein